MSSSRLRASRPVGIVLLLCLLITTPSPGITLTSPYGSSRVVAAADPNKTSGYGPLRHPDAANPQEEAPPPSMLEGGGAALLPSSLSSDQLEARSAPSRHSFMTAAGTQHARRRGRRPAAANHLLEPEEEQQGSEGGGPPSSLMQRKSVTSTKTPSAFTVSDPFAAWTVQTVASPKALPVDQPATPLTTEADNKGSLPEASATAAAAGGAQAPEEGVSQSAETTSEGQAAEAAAAQQTDAAAAAAQKADAAASETTQQSGASAASGAEAAEAAESARSGGKGSETAPTDEQLAAAKAAVEKVALEAGEKTEAEKQEGAEGPVVPPPSPPSQPSTPSASSSEAARAQRRSAAAHGGGTLEKALAQKVEKGCDIATFGPAYCASEDNPRAADILWSLENRKNNTYFVIALCMLAFAILVQCSCRVMERKIIRGGDQFSREVMETAFRQIAYIAIVDVILWGCMQSNVAEILDELIFGDVMPQHRDADIVLENVSPMLEVLFEELFFVAILLLIWYVVFVVLLQCLVRQLASWMRKVDEEEDVTIIARKAEAAQTATCGSCFNSEDIAKAQFVAHRYEFGDNVQTMSIPGIDPSGYYFMEYMRASLMQMAIKMLRLPNSTLVLLMVVAVFLRPFLSFRVHPEAALLSVCSFICLLGMLLTWAYVKSIERQLLPRRVPHYLIMRYHMEIGGDATAGYLDEYTPPYKLQKQKASYFCQLLVLAWWVQLLRCHPATWLRISWWGNVVVGVCALVHFGLLKNVLYSTLIALHSGMLVNNELLEKGALGITAREGADGGAVGFAGRRTYGPDRQIQTL
ncbi:hypothetical protein ACSSS7_007557 [Eimeria intestinalis]